MSATFNPSTNSISNAVFMFKLILDKKNFHPGGVIDNGEEIMFERKRCKLGIIKQMTKEFSGVNWTSEKHTLLLNRTRALDPGITGARIRLIFLTNVNLKQSKILQYDIYNCSFLNSFQKHSNRLKNENKLIMINICCLVVVVF